MLYRKIESQIYQHFKSDNPRVLLIRGARQVGKSFIIRHVGQRLFKNVVEINLVSDKDGERLFENVRTLDQFYFTLSLIAGERLGDKADTLVFLDEIQEYPHLFTMLKFLRQDNRYTYVASGSLLGIALKQSVSIPLGSIEIVDMYPLDFEEFLIANGVGQAAITQMRQSFESLESLSPAVHDKIINHYKTYLIVGGMPAAVNEFLESRNVVRIRRIQKDIHDLYVVDASKYDEDKRLNIRRIYELVPSNMENKKKRLFFNQIEDKRSRKKDYDEDIEYLISSGITLEVKAISNPKFPLVESEVKNLLKLYLNDVGILTNILYRTNVQAILEDDSSVNLGSVYESAVAQQLAALGHRLFYYDNRHFGEVDFLIDDYKNLTVAPIEVKSGKDYKRHSALSRFVATEDYAIKKSYVLSNAREISVENGIVYMPVYFSMFFSNNLSEQEQLL